LKIRSAIVGPSVPSIQRSTENESVNVSMPPSTVISRRNQDT
jgi:hypothetical protein